MRLVKRNALNIIVIIVAVVDVTKKNVLQHHLHIHLCLQAFPQTKCPQLQQQPQQLQAIVH